MKSFCFLAREITSVDDFFVMNWHPLNKLLDGALSSELANLLL